MFLHIPDTMDWRTPWEPLKDSGEVYVVELRKELGSRHVLFDVPVRAIARHVECDDVLFATGDPANPLAVVHLTWASRREPDPRWPCTTLYRNGQDWTERCLHSNHRSYSGTGDEATE